MRRNPFFGLGATTAEVKAMQEAANAVIVPQGYAPIKVDGIIGPKTCGAVREAGLSSQFSAALAGRCATFEAPVRVGAGVPSPGTATPGGAAAPDPTLAPAATSAGVLGMNTKTILIGAGIIGLGVVVVYALKKKSQAAAA